MNKNNSTHKLAEPEPAHHPPSLLLLEKMQRLRIQGYTEEEAERLCKPKEPSLDEVMERLMKWQERELRRLAKLYPTQTKQARQRMEEVDGLPVVRLNPVDLPKEGRRAADVNVCINHET
jgi:hypothetical protein